MDVYFIPLGPRRYELYCEPDESGDDIVGEAEQQGRFASLLKNFRETLARVEQERLSGTRPASDADRPWHERLKGRMLSWIAEKVAEQRLLWRLRGVSDLLLHFPDDMTAAEAIAEGRAELQREADRHLKWVVIDGLLFVASGAFFLVPGPNLIAYYFGFRLVGHFLSRRGAMHGLREVRWETSPSAQLSRLRRVLVLDPQERDREVHQLASELRLPHLAKFVERIAVKTA